MPGVTNTFSANTRIRSASVNTNFTDLNQQKIDYVGFRATTGSGTQTIATGTWTTMALGTDSGTYAHNAGSHYDTGTYTFTVPVDGYYQFFANTGWGTNQISDQKRAGIKIHVNATYSVAYLLRPQSGTSAQYIECTCLTHHFSSGDTVVAQVYQEEGGNKTTAYSPANGYGFFQGWLIARD